jgi:hypothetical protein
MIAECPGREAVDYIYPDAGVLEAAVTTINNVVDLAHLTWLRRYGNAWITYDKLVAQSKSHCRHGRSMEGIYD